MNNYFVTYYYGTSSDQICKHFFSDRKFWEWLSEFKSREGSYPKGMSVYIGECIFDGS